MRVLITGADGFVGPHAVNALCDLFPSNLELIPTARTADGGTEALDITDRSAVDGAIARCRPTHVVHLAGITALPAAASDPDATWRVNLDGTLNLARAILAVAPDCHLINAGSGLIYGESAKSGLPLDETSLLAPMDDYSASKAAADLALGALAHRGLKCIRMRPFNHFGPGQSEHFVATAFAIQIAKIEAGCADPLIHVGNLTSARDFLDVRDVAAAYALAVAKSDTIAPGTILNLASGKVHRINDLLIAILSRSSVSIRVEEDSSRMRPSDLPCVIGNAQRARDFLGWSPKHSFDETVSELMEECRARLV